VRSPDMPDGPGDRLVMGLADAEELPPLAETLEADRLSPRHLSIAKLGGVHW
jgi:hypothetical protein